MQRLAVFSLVWLGSIFAGTQSACAAVQVFGGKDVLGMASGLGTQFIHCRRSRALADAR
jgi:hypothetical protein